MRSDKHWPTLNPSMLEGFINVLKPPGMTSHDVVGWVRAWLKMKRVGHLGTLDPAAAGVLPISLGRATRLFRFASGPDKAYRAEIVFGARTDTLDAEGEVVARGDASSLSEDRLRELVDRFKGEVDQVPPAYSAVHVGGRRLYEEARKGTAPKARAKRVKISDIEVRDFVAGSEARAIVDVVCSTGTYVRTIADDLGEAAGCGAYLGFLVRTRAGRFRLDDAWALEEIASACRSGYVKKCVMPPDWPIADRPKIVLDGVASESFTHGMRVLADGASGFPVRVYGPEGLFLGLAEVLAGGVVQPRVVIGGRQESGNAR